MFARLLGILAAALAACASPNASSPRSPAGPARLVQARSDLAAHRGDARERQEWRKAIAAAEKRAASDPIEIVVCDAALDAAVAEALDARAAMDAIARELWQEPTFRVRTVRAARDVGSARAPACAEAAAVRGFAPDVWVFASAELDDPTVRVRTTGNLLADKTMTVRIEAASAYGTGRSAPCASGPLSDPLAVVTDAARAVRTAILDDLAPRLPSRAAVAGIDGKIAVSEEAVDPATASTLRRLFAAR